MLLTGSSGAAVERCEQRSEQALLGKAGLLLHHREHCPGGHMLKLLGGQLVFEVQEVEDLDNNNNNNKYTSNKQILMQSNSHSLLACRCYVRG